MINNLWIIITTINKPTRAIIEYSKIAARMGWQLLIVGDVNTPDEYRDLECLFLPIEDQKRLYEKFSDCVPFKHYCRKNLGYLYAVQHGAEWIFDTDDDNIPLDNFSTSLGAIRTALSISHNGFVNTYKRFTDEPVWPRGLPLTAIQEAGSAMGTLPEQFFPVQQYLADKDPDVDAIYRLTSNREILFQKNVPAVCLVPGTWSPFNSQATLFHRRIFRALYLPCHVPFRMTDIWRSFVAQKILWTSGSGVMFVGPIVVQERNPHDYFRDFKDEILGYLYNQEICDILESEDGSGISYGMLLYNCYSRIRTLGVIKQEELAIITEWNALLDSFGIE